MAQGYLNSSENPEMEIIGVEYFECLVARSFFQDFQKLEDGSIWACKIHDIVLDFACFLMGNESVLKEVHPDDNLRIKLSSEKTHHLSVILAENARFPTSLLGAKKLRSLYIFGGYAEEKKTGDLFIQPKHLRSLIVREATIKGFPEEVSRLMHLKLLDLSGSWLKRLPEAIYRLCNLQSLCLQRCYLLERLPDKIGELVNLRYLDTTDSYALTYYPKGIGRLTSLRTLLGIEVSFDHNDNKKFSLGDLENLCYLCFLTLLGAPCHVDANEARRAKLQSKIYLKELNLVGLGRIETERDDFIKALNPPSHRKVTFRMRTQGQIFYALFRSWKACSEEGTSGGEAV